ncbi:MAG TPA: chorismate synthase, partial [Clostridiaceae bacterium]|nr:chorismate synthase [Clostridiaceae bacterium]
MGSTWGQTLKISIFGESHGPGIGVVLDGLPAGQSVDLAELQDFMDRRAPGRTPWSTTRREGDRPQILSGLYRGKTTGTPLAVVIRNDDTRSRDYSELIERPRPGHGDLTGIMRYDGANDPRGGGHFSGRLTAPLVAAGGIARQILVRHNIQIFGRIYCIGDIFDRTVEWINPDCAMLNALANKLFPVIDDSQGSRMADAVAAVKQNGDSIGGMVEVVALGFPPGVGDPMFGGLEPRLASIFFAIPAVKAVEFGDGVAVSGRLGSENNDSPAFVHVGGETKLRMLTNHGGGSDGGISNGMPIVVRLAI